MSQVAGRDASSIKHQNTQCTLQVEDLLALKLLSRCIYFTCDEIFGRFLSFSYSFFFFFLFTVHRR